MEGQKRNWGIKEKCRLWFMTCALLVLFFEIILAGSWVQAAESTVPEKVEITSLKMTSPLQITIKWKKVSDATHYRIYRKVNGRWMSIDTVPASQNVYVHNASDKFPIEGGECYIFVIRAYNNKSKKWGPYDKNGYGLYTRPEAPVLKTISSTKNSVSLSWEPVKGATSYHIYYKTGTDTWKRVAKVGLSYSAYTHKSSTDYPLKSGCTYEYMVRSYSNKAKAYSVMNENTLSVNMPMEAPTLESVRTLGPSVIFSWKKVEGATKYYVYCKKGTGKWKRIAVVDAVADSYIHRSTTSYPLKPGITYTYTVRAYNTEREKYSPYDKNGVSVTIPADTDAKAGKSTIKKLLQTALQPVGSTMYILGGAWSSDFSGAGEEATTIGVSTRWEQFYRQQDSTYNHKAHYYEIHEGIDCSGYVGWCIYNIMNTKNGNSGYVMGAHAQAENFASRGWGTYTPYYSVNDYKPGDIMSAGDHVYIVLGQCIDGSIVLLHSSPPGVQITGTATRDGNRNSNAIKLATSYMKKYYPEWYSKYPDSSRGASYLNGYSRMRWDVSGKSVMTDPDKYMSKNAKQILADLFD